MTYNETVEYLFTKLPYFSRLGSIAYKKDITNTVLLCDALDNPQTKFKSIHIAGTNGKGSTSHMLAAIFQQCGYKTGLYTSPHLKEFGERIKVNGIMVHQQFVIDFVERTKTISEKIQPSFFELAVAMAFEYFAQQKIDIAIVETGLGGRLDSTNIIKPELSIITNIGYDHMNILGNTLQEIAFEKAGIIKENVPVVIGEALPETKNIFIDKANECKSPIVFAEDEYEIINAVADVNKLVVRLKNNSQQKNYVLDLNGIYQQKNLRTVLTSIEELKKGFHFDDDKIYSALQNVKQLTGLHGRWDVIHTNPIIVLDVAHNEDGIKQLLHQISLIKFKQLHIVFGVVKDKEVTKILSLLPKNAIYYFTKAQIERALPENELAAKAHEQGLNGAAFSEVNEALKAAIDNSSGEDVILVCGSVFIVGEVDAKKFEIQSIQLS